MPNRIIREGLVDSEPFNALCWQAQNFFVRLMLKADDFGRYFGDPRLLKPYLYALKLEDVREADLQRWIAECEKSGLVRGYDSDDGKRYLLIPKFGQKKRAIKSKFPDPCIADATQMLSNRLASAPVVEGECEDECEVDECAGKSPAPPDSPTVLTYPVKAAPNEPDEWHLKQDKLEEYTKTFIGIDVMAEMRKARQWVIDNPTNRKTARGMPSFLSRWLTRTNDRGGHNAGTTNFTSRPNGGYRAPEQADDFARLQQKSISFRTGAKGPAAGS